ncbi:hypothetical protein AVEN_14156-1 [Araneus ventricosus]|uniref:Uncharacterized protein n=1 Tax=Araneus ventricosus TaxID=182803 RepID=A0A4Y2NZW1_ARAVE|nr:hypothetical protein AVEN_14156-1 [Araneus ventricosus]
MLMKLCLTYSSTAHAAPKDFQYSSFTGSSALQRRLLQRQSTNKGSSQKIECPPKFILSIVPLCPSRQVRHISEIDEAEDLTDAGHGMGSCLRFKGLFS